MTLCMGPYVHKVFVLTPSWKLLMNSQLVEPLKLVGLLGVLAPPLIVAKRRSGAAILLASLFFLSISVISFPILIMWPFVRQAAMPLHLALAVERWAPSVTLIASFAGALVAFRGRAARGERFWIGKNALLLSAVAALGLCAWAARTNIYERIFHPLGNSHFILPSQATVGEGDMVIAVSLNREDRAYPIRLLAYHHLFNDVVGGLPIVATY